MDQRWGNESKIITSAVFYGNPVPKFGKILLSLMVLEFLTPLLARLLILKTYLESTIFLSAGLLTHPK
jgi:hypothetical protein